MDIAPTATPSLNRLPAITRTDAGPYFLSYAGIPPGPNQRLHWAVRARLVAAVKLELAWQARAVYRGPVWAHTSVALTFFYRQVPMDRDNLYGCAKPIIDAFISIFYPDDAEQYVTLSLTQLKGVRHVDIVIKKLA